MICARHNHHHGCTCTVTVTVRPELSLDLFGSYPDDGRAREQQRIAAQGDLGALLTLAKAPDLDPQAADVAVEGLLRRCDPTNPRDLHLRTLDRFLDRANPELVHDVASSGRPGAELVAARIELGEIRATPRLVDALEHQGVELPGHPIEDATNRVAYPSRYP